MRLIRLLSGAGLTLALAAHSALAGDPCYQQCPPSGAPQYLQPGQPAQPSMAGQPRADQAATTPPADNMFAQAPAAGTGAESIGNPNIMGDFLRLGAGFSQQANFSTSFGSFSSSSSRLIPVGGGPLKIAENENVRPQDRIFLTYNGYSNIIPSVNKGAHIDYQYQTAGFETTFFNGNGSFGVRLPWFELNGKSLNETTHFGDMSLVSKFLIAGDAANAISAGLVLTLPTGLKPTEQDGSKIHSYVWQPWWGVTTSLGDNAYFQGFNSLAIPSVRDDATVMFFDAAVGYWAYRGDNGGWMTGVVPTSEVHVNWPWTNRGAHNTTHAINEPSSIDLTEGVHFLFGHATLALGVSFCVSGPRIYDFEGIAQLNIGF